MTFVRTKTVKMLWFTLILFLLIGVMLWSPFELEVDTKKTVYRAGWKGVIGIRAKPSKEGWQWYYNLFFFKKEWCLPKKASKPPPKKPPSKRGWSISPRKFWQLFKRTLKAIKVKRLIIDWDTNDFVTNAYLYPLSHLLKKPKQRFQINFSGKQELSIWLQARPYRLVVAFLQSFF